MNIGTLIATLGVDTTGLSAASRGMDQFGRSATTTMNSIQSRVDVVSKNLQTLGSNMTKYMTIPLGLVGGAAFKMSKDFESAMEHITGLVGESQQQVDQWSSDILEFGPALARGPKELADALYFVTSSGIKGAAAMDVVTESAKAASAGLGETQQIADLVTSAMNAYKSSNLSASKTLDILTAAVREGKGEASAFAGVMGEVIPIAAKMNVSFDQVAAAMSAMTLTGTNASESATYMRQILTSLLDPAKQSEEALKGMGTSSEELRKTISEQGLLAGLTKLNTLTGKYGEEIMAKVFPNVRALTGVLSLMGDRLEGNAEIFKKVANSSGDMEKAFQSASQTTEFKYNAAIAQSEASLISFGHSMKSVIIPILDGFADTLKSVTKWWDGLSGATQETIVYITAAAAAMGPLTLGISALMKTMTSLVSVGSSVIGMFKGLGAFIVANPYLALAAGATAAMIAMANWSKKSDEFSQIQGEVNTKVSEEVFKLNDVFERLKDTSKGTSERAETLKVINQRYGAYLDNLLTEKTSLEDIEKAQRQATTALVASISIKEYKSKLEEEIGSISQAFEKQMSGFVNAFGKTYGSDRIGEFISAIYSEADKVIQENGGIVNESTMKKGLDIYNQYVDQVSKKSGYMKYSWEDFSKAWRSFIETKATKNQVVSQIQAMISAYDKLGVVQKKTEEQTTPTKTPTNTSLIDTESLKKVQEVMDNVRGQEEYLSLATQVLGSDFDEIGGKISAYKSGLESLLKIKGVTATTKEVQVLTEKLSDINMEAYDTTLVMDDLYKSLDGIDAKSTVLGKQYDSAKAKSEAYNKALNSMAEYGVTAGAGLEKVRKGVVDSQAALQVEKLKEYNDQLEFTKYQNTILSDSTDNLSLRLQNLQAELEMTKSQLKDAWDQGKRPGDIDVDVLTDRIKNLNAEMAKIAASKEMLSSLGSSFSKLGSALSDADENLSDWLDWIGSLLSDLPDIIKLINLMTASTQSATAATQSQTAATAASSIAKATETANSAASTVAGATEAATSATVTAAKSSEAIAGATASGAKMPFPTNLIAIAAGIAAVVAALATIPGMANGGIVPAGYPNDTYPALLTSGERVVPPGKLDNLQNNSNSVGGDVRFRIEGYDLVGLLQKQNKKKSLV